MTARWRPWPWATVILASAVVFFLGLPALAQWGPQGRPVEPGERVPIMVGSVEPPAQWHLDLPSAARGQPEVTGEGVAVTVSSGLWFGASAALLAQLGELLEESGAQVDDPPPAPDEEPAIDAEPVREEFRLTFTIDDDAGELWVVREGLGVVAINATGPADAVSAQVDVLQTMAASARTDVMEAAVPSAAVADAASVLLP